MLSKFGEEHLVMVNYACGFNQSETGKYFEWIIIKNIAAYFRKFNLWSAQKLIAYNIANSTVFVQLSFVFLNYWLATVILFQKSGFISLLLPLLKDFQNPRPFPAAGVWYPTFAKLLSFWSCNWRSKFLLYWKKMETPPLEVDKEFKHWQKCPNVTRHYLRFLQKYLPS